MPETTEDQREITSLDQLCVFELLKNELIQGHPINYFEVMVTYHLFTGITPPDGTKYNENHLIGGREGPQNRKHILVPSPDPDVSYGEMPGLFHGIICAEGPDSISWIKRATEVYVQRNLEKQGMILKPNVTEVSDPSAVDLAEPWHMAFLINQKFNYAVGSMQFAVKGYGVPPHN